MEILSQSTDWGSHIFFLSVVIIFALISVVVFFGIVVMTICDGIDSENVVGAIVSGLFAALMIFVAIIGIQDGPTTTYKAIVTDYNVVYEEGYEIISTDGKIVTLTKGDE